MTSTRRSDKPLLQGALNERCLLIEATTKTTVSDLSRLESIHIKRELTISNRVDSSLLIPKTCADTKRQVPPTKILLSSYRYRERAF
jgi:hypothetical protein